MSSIYARALGDGFFRLHPELQRRYDLRSQADMALFCRGVMEEIWHGPALPQPVLRLAARRRLLFTASGRDIPFTLANYPYVDRFGREAVIWVRTLRTEPPGHFTSTMVYNARRGCLVEYLGTHQNVAVEIFPEVDARGGFRMRSGRQRFFEGPLACPIPAFASGQVEGCEWFEEETGRFRVEMRVENPARGPLFGYRGWFEAEWVPAGELPEDVRPRREERRE